MIIIWKKGKRLKMLRVTGVNAVSTWTVCQFINVMHLLILDITAKDQELNQWTGDLLEKERKDSLNLSNVNWKVLEILDVL